MKNGPIGKVLKCKNCQFRVHAGKADLYYSALYSAQRNAGSCGAIVDPALIESWTCELCNNEELLEASIVSILFCLL